VIAAGLDYETDSVHTISYRVARGSLSDTGSIRISVLNVNEFPYGRTLVVMKDHALEVGDLVEFLSAVDPEGDAITLRALSSTDGTFYLKGDSLITDSPLAFVQDTIYRVPIEISAGSRTDTFWVEIHMVAPEENDTNSNYIRGLEYHNGILTITSGPGFWQVSSLQGDRLASGTLTGNGTQQIVVNLQPGVYVVTVGCAHRILVVSGN